MAAKRSRKRAAATAEPEKATLRWLKVHRFRHVAPCELHFSPTYNVLLGLNGTGKTTLLELISAALRFNFAKMKKEPFFIEYELGSPEGMVRASVRNDEALAGRPPRGERSYEPSAELVLFVAAKKRLITLRVDEFGSEIEVDNKKTRSDDLRADRLYGSGFFLHVLTLSGLAQEKRALAAMTTALGHWDNNRRFDEELWFLRSVAGASTRVALTKGAYGMAYAIGPVPRSIVAEALRQSRSWGGAPAPSLTVSQEQVALLSQMAQMLGFERVELRLTHLNTDVKGSTAKSYFGELRFMLQRADGSVIPHSLLSYGQKRALSLHYYLAVNERAIIADELVDGLHHAWIVDAIEAIGDRQAFLASQNPLLLDYLEFDSAEKVRKSFVQCRLEKHGKGERMIWSNMTEYDAARFFEAYQVGLQHVSEILRTKGLW